MIVASDGSSRKPDKTSSAISAEDVEGDVGGDAS